MCSRAESRGGEAVVGQVDRGLLARHDAHAQRGVARSAGQPGGVVRRRRPDLAVRRSPRDRAWRRRTARRRRRSASGRCGGSPGASRGVWAIFAAVQIGVDVGAAERVDRLLGVGDEHERHALPAANARSRICHWIGSVSWNSSTSTTSNRERSRSRAAGPLGPCERVVQPREQIVVGHDRQPPLALLELIAHGPGQAVAHGRGAVGRLVTRLELRHRVVHRRPRDLERLGAAEPRPPSRGGETGGRTDRRAPPRAGRRRPRRTRSRGRGRRPSRARPAPPGRSHAWSRSWRRRSRPPRGRAGRAGR